MIRPICATWINTVSKKHANRKATGSWRAGTGAVAVASKDKVFVFFQQVASLFLFAILVKLLGGRWERERKLGVCKLVFGTQLKSVANIMRVSMESTKQMWFCQGQDRAKCSAVLEADAFVVNVALVYVFLLGPLQTGPAPGEREGE